MTTQSPENVPSVLTDEEIMSIGVFGQSPLKRLDHGRAIEKAVIAKYAAPATVGQAEYRRGLMEAFHHANMASANRQGRTAEGTCSYIVRSLADLANGATDTSHTPPAGEGQEPVAQVWVNDPRYLHRHSFEAMVGIEGKLSDGLHLLYTRPAPQAAQPAASVERVAWTDSCGHLHWVNGRKVLVSLYATPVSAPSTAQDASKPAHGKADPS